MSRIMGPVRQLGNIVHDMNAALRYWTETMGAGPFYIMRNIRFENFQYRGKPAESPCVSLAFGQAGPLQIELIAQHDDLPSGYQDFLLSGREGAQHLASWFDNETAYDAAYHRLLSEGLFVRHESTGPGPRFSYFSRGDGIYPELELAEGLLPSQNGFFDHIAQQSVDWDGSNPVRLPDGTPDPEYT
jgi:catechol 2,3-dioxygenase-like lactoylglutathione lyase family enzyme